MAQIEAALPQLFLNMHLRRVPWMNLGNNYHCATATFLTFGVGPVRWMRALPVLSPTILTFVSPKFFQTLIRSTTYLLGYISAAAPVLGLRCFLRVVPKEVALDAADRPLAVTVDLDQWAMAVGTSQHQIGSNWKSSQ